jgi:pilus assembly protein CpaF
MFEVIIQSAGGVRKNFRSDGSRCVIGNSWRADLALKGRQVARQHALIERTVEGLRICDLGSSTGTWVNRERITDYGPLRAEDEIVVGEHKLTVVDQARPLPQQADRAPPSASRHTDARNNSDEGRDLDPARLDTTLLAWRRSIHDRILEAMDLRRKDLHSMSDLQVRRETEALLEEILGKIADEIPPSIERSRLRQEVLDEAVGLGPLQSFLDDDSVSEIMVNAADQIFVERAGRLVLTDCCFTSDQAVHAVIERIITPLGRRIDEASPMVDARLKDGSRVNAVIAPLAIKGPSITIRKFAKKRLQFSDLVSFDSLSQEMVEFLRVCVERRKNIVVAGGTGSGKTTLLNVLSNLIPKDERVVTVEDAAELQLNQPNLVALETKPANIEGKGQVTIRDLVRNALRMRPDRIVVGECRGAEAIDMLQAMNTGHDGSLTTVHANTPRDVISRLEVMVMMGGMDLPIQAIREQVAAAVDVIVQQKRFPCGARKVTHVTELVGIESGTIQLQNIFVYQQQGVDGDGRVRGRFQGCGFVPSFYEEFSGIGLDMDLSLFGGEQEQRL